MRPWLIIIPQGQPHGWGLAGGRIQGVIRDQVLPERCQVEPAGYETIEYGEWGSGVGGWLIAEPQGMES